MTDESIVCLQTAIIVINIILALTIENKIVRFCSAVAIGCMTISIVAAILGGANNG